MFLSQGMAFLVSKLENLSFEDAFMRTLFAVNRSPTSPRIAQLLASHSFLNSPFLWQASERLYLGISSQALIWERRGNHWFSLSVLSSLSVKVPHMSVASPLLKIFLCPLCWLRIWCSAWTPARCATVGETSPVRVINSVWGLPCWVFLFLGIKHLNTFPCICCPVLQSYNMSALSTENIH